MPAGSEGPTVKPGATKGAQTQHPNLGPPLRNAVEKVDTRKHGQPSLIYILVGPEVTDYDVDLTFVPTMIHLKKKDPVKWQLEGASSFTLQFVGKKTPLDRDTFDSKNDTGIVRDDAEEGRYRYNLTSLTTLKGKKIDYGPAKYCPEIIIQR
jgi:hypothetical protein